MEAEEVKVSGKMLELSYSLIDEGWTQVITSLPHPPFPSNPPPMHPSLLKTAPFNLPLILIFYLRIYVKRSLFSPQSQLFASGKLRTYIT